MTWQEMRIEHIADSLSDTVEPGRYGEQLVAHYSIPALDEFDAPVIERASEIQSNKQPLSGGEVLISKLNPRKARVHQVARDPEHPMLCSGEFIVLRPRSVEPRFLTYLLLAESTRRLLDAFVQSVTRSHQRVRPEILTKLKVRVPPAEEQRAIADYLDTETARIDALITKKQQLVAAVEERYAALLNSLVAPDGLVERRSSPRWPQAAFGAVVRVAEGQVDPRDEPYRGMLLLAPNHIESGTGRVVDLETAHQQGAISGKYQVEPGDVVYSKIRPALAKAALADVECLCSADMYPLRVGPQLLAEFLWYLVLSPAFTEIAALESERVAMPKINRDALSRLRIPVPPIADQRSIVNDLREANHHRRDATDALRKQIELLQERRRALVTAAVTGEFRVPGVG